MKTGFRLILITLPLVLLGVGFIAYTIANKPAPEQVEAVERAISVRVVTAKTTRISPTVSGFGLVAPARSYQAIPQVSGTAEYVNPLLKKGDILSQGAVLLRLSASDYTLSIAQARANIRAAEARLAEIDVSEENQKLALAIEQETLALKEDDLERAERLYKAGSTPQTTRDGAKAVYLTQRQKVQSLQGTIALLPTQKRVQTEQIAVYQVSLETAELNLARTELRLPFAARVATVSVEVGQFVGAGKAIASFDGVKTAEVEAQIPASDMLKLFQPSGTDQSVTPINPAAVSGIVADLGLQASIRLKLGDTNIDWPAKLDRISNTIDQKSGTVGAIVRIDNAYSGIQLGSRPPLTKGMFVEVTLKARPTAGIIIPRSALRAGHVLVVADQSRLKRLPVTVRFVQGDIALISQGLEDGMQIVVSTPVPVIEGMLLDLHPDTALMQTLAKAGSVE